MTLSNFTVYACLVLTVTWIISSASGKPIQVLENIPGFIPVYIRYGNEPLESINPSLAEAFQDGKDSGNAISLEQPDVPELDEKILEKISQIPHLRSSRKKREILYSTFQE